VHGIYCSVSPDDIRRIHRIVLSLHRHRTLQLLHIHIRLGTKESKCHRRVGSRTCANVCVARLGNALASNGHNGVASALATPGHTVVTVSDTDHKGLISFVLLPGGRGYRIHSILPVLPSAETYQLWSIVRGSPVSIGVMGPSPRAVAFTFVGSTGPSKLAVTIEPAGGSCSIARKSHTPELFRSTRPTSNNTIRCNFKTRTINTTLQYALELALNQQVPGSSCNTTPDLEHSSNGCSVTL
jgi:hypothetical protein